VRNSDRVKVACLAQLVNVIAPIMTNSSGLLRQTIFYPYSWGLKYAKGSVLNLVSEAPTYQAGKVGEVPYLDVVGTFSHDNGNTCLFILNRDLKNAQQVEVNWEDAQPQRVVSAVTLTGSDLKASNTFDKPKQVVPQDLGKVTAGKGSTQFEVPPHSYTVIQWAV
jgi:alpha-L-arabinofuranosidase